MRRWITNRGCSDFLESGVVVRGRDTEAKTESKSEKRLDVQGWRATGRLQQEEEL